MVAKTRECLAVTNCMTECDTASHVHCPSKDSQMFNFWGYLSHKLAQAKSSLLNIYERQRFSCSPSLYKQRLTNGHLLREHIDVQYFFVMWVVKYRFHLVGQLARGKVYLQANKIFEKTSTDFEWRINPKFCFFLLMKIMNPENTSSNVGRREPQG